MGLLHDDPRIFVDQMRRMVAEKVEPRAADIDREGGFPWDLKKIFQELVIARELLRR